MQLVGYSRSEINFLNSALALARESECNQRVAAIVVKGGCVMAKATNKDHNHPTVLETREKIRASASICAERRALAMLTPETARGAVVYVARVRRVDDDFGVSKPCERCEVAMEAMGIKRAVYVH